MSLLRRLLGLGNREAGGPGSTPDAVLTEILAPSPLPEPAEEEASAAGADAEETGPPRPEPVPCPYCATPLDPPPPRTRRCPSCRQQVIVRRADGLALYLTESSAAVMDAERRREADERVWTPARRRWLQLALSVHAPVDLCRQVAAMTVSDRAVEAARDVYRTAADQAVREARRGGQWVVVHRIRIAEAEALYADSGWPVPPPDDILALHREAKSAVLQSLAANSTVAELAGSDCCRICRSDDGMLCKISAELRKPRLPHAGCPKGLCGCDWFIAVPEAKPARKRRRRPAAGPAAASAAESSDALAEGEADDGAEVGFTDDPDDPDDPAQSEAPLGNDAPTRP